LVGGLGAGAEGSADQEKALDKLCQTYWYPLYAFIRRRGYDTPDAQDLTQDFFAQLLKGDMLKKVDQERGKFRSFLLASLKNFLANDWDRNHALKRGGKVSIISWDAQAAEDRYRDEPYHQLTPEKIFEQSWALAVIKTVLERLKEEYGSADKGQLFELIQPILTGDSSTESYVSIASQLGMTEGAVKMAVLRMRRHFAYLLRAEISQTVSDSRELEEEVRHLFTAVAG
jgi:RNA polymerase sigma factor (sigma-70 family)